MKKLIPIFIIIAAAIAGTIFFFTQKQEENLDIVPSFKPLIKVGFIYPMSGDAAHIGQALKTALKLFEQDAKTKNSKYSFEMIVEDNQLNPAKSVAPTNKLKTVDNVNAYISIGSNVSNVVSLIAEKNEIIHFAIAIEKPAKSKYNFTVATPANKMAEKLLKELQKKGLTKAALVTQNQAAMLAIGKEIRAQHKTYGINLTSDNIINSGDRDFRILIAKILQNKPDIIIVQIYIPEISLFVKQLKDADPNIKITGAETLAYPDDKRLLEGYWFVDGSAASSAYRKSFEKETGSTSTNYSEAAYAALQILRDTVDAVGSRTDDIITYLKAGHEFKTAYGTLRYNSEGIMQSEAVLKQIKNGQPVLIEE